MSKPFEAARKRAKLAPHLLSPLALGHVMSGVGTQSPALPEEESLLPACFIIVEPQPFIAVSS
ncbi:hypothetical protein [Marinobacter flavimaris]|uniref:hypothetical protein n=1 Tax=Marinobacter flavimaris TaxID=262076 RepID=UPI001304FFFB|nr:hypothetical protein [Marinobacter flavimaris]